MSVSVSASWTRRLDTETERTEREEAGGGSESLREDGMGSTAGNEDDSEAEDSAREARGGDPESFVKDISLVRLLLDHVDPGGACSLSHALPRLFRFVGRWTEVVGVGVRFCFVFWRQRKQKQKHTKRSQEDREDREEKRREEKRRSRREEKIEKRRSRREDREEKIEKRREEKRRSRREDRE